MENLETLRDVLHLTQQEFADLIGCQKINIGQWDSNQRALPTKLITHFLYLTDLLNHAISEKGEVQDTYQYINETSVDLQLRQKKLTLLKLEEFVKKLKAKIKGHKKRLLIKASSKRNNNDETLELAITLMGREADEDLPKLEKLLFKKELRIASLKGEVAYLENVFIAPK